MKYAFIQTNKNYFNIAELCKYIGVSKSGYYNWLKKPIGKRALANRKLKPRIYA